MSKYKEYYDYLRYQIVPPVFLLFFTGSVQFLALHGHGDEFNFSNITKGLLGNTFSWTVVIGFFIWAIIWLKLPYLTTKGPISPDGVIPIYKDNGVPYYFASIGAYLILEHFMPDLSIKIYNNNPEILGSLNILALILCIYLYISSKSSENLPKLYLFYRGMDFHPKLLNVDVKQLTNCRIGLMLWQLMPLSFFIASCKLSQFNFPAFVSLLIQSIYILKFFIWEAGYFRTIDITLDRAGYYLCWGCIVWVPAFFNYTSYYFVKYPPNISNLLALVIAIVGISALYTQYRVDMERMVFRAQKGNCLIWGSKPSWIEAKYENNLGKMETSLLLTSGFWGMARHFNYTFEMIFGISFNCPGFNLGFATYMYPIFIIVLLFHRIYRDEDKCKAKYGKYWNQYCKKVPYRLIPYIF